MTSRRLGFVSTRFAGTDGVSLEAAKWAQVLGGLGWESVWFGGILDRDPAVSRRVPEASFAFPEIAALNTAAFGATTRSRSLTRQLFELSEVLKDELYRFVDDLRVDVLVVQNALSIPMNLPLGMALTNFIAETGIPTIAHHHDFSWERERFSVSAVGDVLASCFPPVLPSIQHVTINSAAQQELAMRRGVSSIMIPNVVDFDSPPPTPDGYSADFREQIGLSSDDVLVLQPTRVIPRKGIERAIELVGELGDPRFKLVVSHDAGDEGYEYERMLRRVALRSKVDLRFVSTRVADERQTGPNGEKLYSLWDVYPHADLVTFTSVYEGFGNALLEAFYFRKPVVVNRYSVFVEDIEPKGFRTIPMTGYLTADVLDEVRRVIDDPEYRAAMVDHNFRLGQAFYSFRVLRRKLRALLSQVTGEDFG